MRTRGRGSPGERRGLGRPFATLWGATAIANIGDGVLLAAVPLLVASITDNPALVGWAVFVQRLPWLLFSLISGVVVDRIDRRRLIVVVHLSRSALIGGLALAVWGDAVNIPVIYAVAFLLGTCETLGDNAAVSLLPATVRVEDLPRANARMELVYSVINQLTAPPLGAALFAVAVALPFGVNAASYVVAALLIATLRGALPAPAREPARAPARSRRRVRAEIAEGVRWLWNQPVIRLVAVVLTLMNVTLVAAFSLLVLYAKERLGLGEVGYGLLYSASAAGGLLGALCAARLHARFGPPVLLRAALVLETLTHVGLALAGTVWLAAPVLLLFGAHNAVFRVVIRTLRQRAVPDALRGRVESVFMMFSMGGAALGALVGGPIAGLLGVTGPFWISAVLMSVLTLVAWRPFGRQVADAARGDRGVAVNGGQTGAATGQPPRGDEPAAR
ncbi:MFS transporter [Streptomyces sp. 3MP-14]|uniref:MFS transporter n=1 Tax=Streptomyces mimosae TaxID=2586635 RepID=A0A5N6A6E2_9ACTN|nr:MULTISPECIES: MFS transporter [Streptomyces]KAB8163802.1 MFS transporter [Streptomyces mimosae]KAB8175245.1 MFS transporter [Streptomyces sp. 3MP-14]